MFQVHSWMGTRNDSSPHQVLSTEPNCYPSGTRPAVNLSTTQIEPLLMKSLQTLTTFVILTLFFQGCGGGRGDAPETGTVTGVVTLDGAPLVGANVEFYPETGRASLGQTDSSGRYELTYTGSIKGAKLGRHTVRITTVSASAEGGDAASERLPDKYHSQSTLSAEVVKGANTFNFPLTTN